MRHLLITATLLAMAIPGASHAVWTDCPGSYAGAACDDPGYDVCELDASGDIVCTLTNTFNRIYVVSESGTAWAYGVLDIAGAADSFCCSFATYGDVEIYGGSDVDLICLVDDDIHACVDNEAGTQVFDNASYIDAGAGSDRITTATTGAYSDVVYGGPGDDLIGVHGGADTVYGGDGDDRIDGGDGDDKLHGDEDDDSLMGGTGNDILTGDAGDDTLYGHAGDDDLCGGEDADMLYGGPDDDCLCHYNSGAVSDAASDYLEGAIGADEGYWRPGDPDTTDGSISLLETCTCACP